MTLSRRQWRSLFGLLVALVLNLAYFVWPDFQTWTDEQIFSQPKKETLAPEEALVLRVIDGDTFELSGGEKVRLIGVDTPESVKPNTPVQCFSQEASAFLRELLEGETVRLEKDVSERDRYGRLLRYAYLGEVLVNEKIVREGYATAASFPPDIAKQSLFQKAEKKAREAERGLWATSACDGKR